MTAHTKTKTISFAGKPITVVGPTLVPGDIAPTNFTLIANDLSPVFGAALAGQPRVICAVLSLDTSVCDAEMKRFSQEITELSSAQLYAVSMDLPFTQKRWCLATGSKRVQALSDFKDRSFGPAYGVMSPDLGFLTRAVFVVGKDDRILHAEYVKEATNEPNYTAALAALHAAI